MHIYSEKINYKFRFEESKSNSTLIDNMLIK